jgi:succinyl-CoA synthetase alpha subunit
MVGGVTPGKGGQKHLDRPVFNTVHDAVAGHRRRRHHDLRARRLRRGRHPGSGRCRHRVIVCITEGIPVLDMLRVKAALADSPACA